MALDKPPSSVRALVLTRRPGSGALPDYLEMAQVPAPAPRKREVTVRVLASTINIDDIHVAEGTFCGGIPIGARPSPSRPVTPGSDVAGIAIGIGRGVRSVRIGDPVFGVALPFRARGAWEEVCAIDERWLTAKPEPLSFAMAASCGVSGLVAHSAIRSLRLHAGATLLVIGATGGIGGMVVQLAVRAGAKVIGVCSSEHLELAHKLGCSRVVDYHRGPWNRRLIATGEAPVDRVLDTVGGLDIEEAGKSVLRKDGAFVTIVGPERFIGDRALGWPGVLAMFSRVGFAMLTSRIRGPRYILTGPGFNSGSALAEVAAFASAGILPTIDSTVPFELEAIRQALKRAAAHRNSGRIVVEMGKAA